MSIDKITQSAIAISEVLTEAQINTRASQERVRRQTKPKKALNTFKVGDRVWRQNIRSQQRKGGKLEANFIGPYTITLLEGKSADLVDERGVKFPKINVDHLRLHVEELPRIPHKLTPSSSSASVPVVFASSSSPASPPPEPELAPTYSAPASPPLEPELPPACSSPASPQSVHVVSSAPPYPACPPPEQELPPTYSAPASPPLEPEWPPACSSPASTPPEPEWPPACSSPASPQSVHVISSAPSSPVSPPPVHATASSGVVTSLGSNSSDIESRMYLNNNLDSYKKTRFNLQCVNKRSK